ncbi:hypothetical protein Pyn_30870 [Prunus yedoensis var. nudiflora]|uniref:Uncharacterized protein n=1 Tax=Prunus yedoensis var. nudiflora TaxID=2094558 RepID=A0A314UB76_PRUYE|nr:hypothetical protein Pyn_30870 [Prunus yedoensis var. nudiflora]
MALSCRLGVSSSNAHGTIVLTKRCKEEEGSKRKAAGRVVAVLLELRRTHEVLERTQKALERQREVFHLNSSARVAVA